MYQMGNRDPPPLTESFLSLVKLNTIVEQVLENLI